MEKYRSLIHWHDRFILFFAQYVKLSKDIFQHYNKQHKPYKLEADRFSIALSSLYASCVHSVPLKLFLWASMQWKRTDVITASNKFCHCRSWISVQASTLSCNTKYYQSIHTCISSLLLSLEKNDTQSFTGKWDFCRKILKWSILRVFARSQ